MHSVVIYQATLQAMHADDARITYSRLGRITDQWCPTDTDTDISVSVQRYRLDTTDQVTWRYLKYNANSANDVLI